MYYDQIDFEARLEWGAEGVERLARAGEVVVIVDVLSFSTAVDVAVARGAVVFPYRWRDASAAAFAREMSAQLAVGRSQLGPGSRYSLSPASLLTIASGTRLVLPSPNGSTLAALATRVGATVLAGCLRNADAIARAVRSFGGPVTVIAAGERWMGGDGALRPAVEDLVGAGAILAALGPTAPSPEAVAAIAAFEAAAPNLQGYLASCSSGRELRAAGFAQDVAIAAELNESDAVPVMKDGVFTRVDS